MAIKRYLDEDGLAVVAEKVNEKLKVVSAIPASPSDKQVVLYVGTTTDDYKQGGIYMYVANDTAWKLISTADVEIDDALSTTSTNPVQNKVVTSALAEKLPIVDVLPDDDTDYSAVILSTDGHNYTWDADASAWVDRTPTPVAPDLSAYSKNLIAEKQSDITAEQIEEYDTFDTNDEAGDGAMVFGDVAAGDKNPVSGGDVYDAIKTVGGTSTHVASDVDLDTLRDAGIYYCSGADTATNKPTDVANWILQVIAADTRRLQIFYGGNNIHQSTTELIYVRIWGIVGLSWSAWRIVK